MMILKMVKTNQKPKAPEWIKALEEIIEIHKQGNSPSSEDES